MPKLSERATLAPSSPIRKLVPFAEAAKARGIEVIHLNIGQPDIESPEEFWQAIRKTKIKVLEYSHSAGNISLRKRAARFYTDHGIQVQDNELMITTAGSEAIRFAFLACLNPGDEVIIPEPMYANYISFAVEANIKVVPITTRIENDFALPSIDEFEKKITLRTKAIMICNPNNPTGAVFSADQMEELRELVLKHDLFLFADEVYREFNYTDEPLVSVLHLKGLEKHAVMIDSVSKRFSLCGARLGFLVTRNQEMLASALKFAQARLSPPSLAQIGVEAALETKSSYFDGVKKEYLARRNLLSEALSKMKGVLCPKIHGAFYAIVRLPIDDSDHFCQWLLEDFSYEGATVMLAPATGFYATSGFGKDEVRIAYVLALPQIARAMRCLEEALKQYPQKYSGMKP